MYRKITRHALACGFLFLSYGLYAQSPGGVERHSLWLKGNFFADTTHALRLNFNPATSMENGLRQIKLPGYNEGLKRATIFTVYQNEIVDQELPVWQMNGDFGDLIFSTRQLSSKSGKMQLMFEKMASGSPKQVKTETFISTYTKHGGLQQIGESGNSNEGLLLFGNNSSVQDARHTPGLVAEYIMYETILKEKDITLVESYLALKYGITLQKNYLSSKGKIIWNRNAEKSYSSNIAGIGRDDLSALYQKQGTSCSTTDLLTIGVKKIVTSNSQNTGELNDNNYLIWGDNGLPPMINRDESLPKENFLLSKKKWIITPSGKTANSISTQLKIDTKSFASELKRGENFYLAIDRSGSGEFLPGNCTYLPADTISTEGIAIFSGVVWDKDRSGKDAFSFAVKSTLSDGILKKEFAKTTSFRVYPNPSADGHYNIAVKLDKIADLNIEVYDLLFHLIESRKVTGRSDYLVPVNIKGAAGSYLVKLFTESNEFSQVIIKQ